MGSEARLPRVESQLLYFPSSSLTSLCLSCKMRAVTVPISLSCYEDSMSNTYQMLATVTHSKCLISVKNQERVEIGRLLQGKIFKHQALTGQLGMRLGRPFRGKVQNIIVRSLHQLWKGSQKLCQEVLLSSLNKRSSKLQQLERTIESPLLI